MNRIRNKTFLFSAGISLFIMAGVFSTRQPAHQGRNLQVLPKDISEQKLDSIMHAYNIALGVDCKFCHSERKVFPGGMDYESDANPMKNNARDMIRMMTNINQTYFRYDTIINPVYLHVVNCYTCHRGEAIPPENH